jgi:hypothetical protein
VRTAETRSLKTQQRTMQAGHPGKARVASLRHRKRRLDVEVDIVLGELVVRTP